MLQIKLLKEQKNALKSDVDRNNKSKFAKRKIKTSLSLSLRKRNARQHRPSRAKLGNLSKLDLAPRRASQRTNETVSCAKVIHRATNDDLKPALDGLWSTLVTNTPEKILGEYIESTPKVLKRVIAPVVKKQVKEFEKSEQNAVRSMKVLYNGGLVSKGKYKKMRSDAALNSNRSDTSTLKSSMEFIEGVPVPKLLTYDKVQSFIRSLDMDPLHELKNLYTPDNDEDPVNGVYIGLESLLLRMAKLYLTIDSKFYSVDNPLLNWFGDEKGTFKVAIGADGAPFGKDSEATAWLISFLNVGKSGCLPL